MKYLLHITIEDRDCLDIGPTVKDLSYDQAITIAHPFIDAGYYVDIHAIGVSEATSADFYKRLEGDHERADS